MKILGKNKYIENKSIVRLLDILSELGLNIEEYYDSILEDNPIYVSLDTYKFLSPFLEERDISNIKNYIVLSASNLANIAKLLDRTIDDDNHPRKTKGAMYLFTNDENKYIPMLCLYTDSNDISTEEFLKDIEDISYRLEKYIN